MHLKPDKAITPKQQADKDFAQNCPYDGTDCSTWIVIVYYDFLAGAEWENEEQEEGGKQ